MRKILFMLTLLAAAVSATAQDVIVKKDGATIVCRVLGVSATEITYKKWTDQKGATYIIDRSLVARIDYQDGRQDNLNEQTSNVYAPGNQNTGTGRYNDNALLALDKSLNTKPKKAKRLRIAGWVVGGSCVAAGTIMIAVGARGDGYYDYDLNEISTDGIGLCSAGSAVAISGIAVATGCLIKANKIMKKANSLTSAPMLQHEFSLPNGNSLAASVDMMQDGRFKTSNLGVGLKFNF